MRSIFVDQSPYLTAVDEASASACPPRAIGGG
jgi:hypothetical protein